LRRARLREINSELALAQRADGATLDLPAVSAGCSLSKASTEEAF
jgi:hypothetical protein